LVVFPLKGRPLGGGWPPPLLATAFLINGAWGLGTGWIFKTLSARRRGSHDKPAGHYR